jgi:hypothetical protein
MGDPNSKQFHVPKYLELFKTNFTFHLVNNVCTSFLQRCLYFPSYLFGRLGNPSKALCTFSTIIAIIWPERTRVPMQTPVL